MILLLWIISFTFPGSIYSGDRIFYYDARSMASGGASVVNANGVNPAVFPENRFRVNFIYNPVFTSEKRGLRVYDSYGNNMGISTIDENVTSTDQYCGSLAIRPLNFFYLGGRFVPAWNFSYNYRHESRDDFYQPQSIEEITNQGAIDDLEPMIGLAIGRISIGVSYIIQYGNIRYRYSLITNSGADSIMESSTSYQGSTGRAGIYFKSKIGLDLGYVYTYRSSLSANNSGADLNYPTTQIIG